MHRLHIIRAAAAALALVAGSAQAFTCYTLYDRSDNIMYRSTFPPVDMSNAGDAERDAMRAAGQYLVFAEADNCPPVVFRFGDAGTRNLSIDNVVGGLTPMSQISRAPATPARAPRTPPAGNAGNR